MSSTLPTLLFGRSNPQWYLLPLCRRSNAAKVPSHDRVLRIIRFSTDEWCVVAASCRLHALCSERIARAAQAHWIDDDGAVDDSGRFAHLLLESFLALDELNPSGHWDEVVKRCVVYLHENVRGEDGGHGNRWRGAPRRSQRQIALLDQASAARIYWLAAEHFQRESE